GRGDVTSIGRKSISHHFGYNGSAPGYCRFIALQYQRCTAATGDQPGTVGIKRPAGFGRVAVIRCEYTQSIEARHTVFIDLLCSTADDHILHAILNQQKSETYGMRTTGTGCTDGHINTFQFENCGQVHRDRGVHRFEYRTAAY